MKVKTSELQAAALDWAVAVAERAHSSDIEIVLAPVQGDPEIHLRLHGKLHRYCPSLDWSQGGPIIDRERIVLREFSPVREDWEAEIRLHHINAFGPSPLSAAMRCFVALKLGDELDIPDELAPAPAVTRKFNR